MKSKSLFIFIWFLSISQNFLAMDNARIAFSYQKWWNDEAELKKVYPLLKALPKFRGLRFNQFKESFLLLDDRSKQDYKSLINRYQRSYLSKEYSFSEWFEMSDAEKHRKSRLLLSRFFVEYPINELENKAKDLQKVLNNPDEMMIESYKFNYHMTPREYLDILKEEIRTRKASKQTLKSSKSES
jgi:hypothetical protein